MEIVSVTHRENPPAHAATGVLQLLFRNLKDKHFFIPTSCFDMCSEGPPFYAKKGLSDGDFAIIRYDWYDVKNNLVLTGICDLSGAPIDTKPGEPGSLLVPILLPDLGTYELRIVFDNKRIEKIALTHGSVDPDQIVFFVATDQQKIEIAAFQKERPLEKYEMKR